MGLMLTNWKSSSRNSRVVRKVLTLQQCQMIWYETKELLESEVLPLLRHDRFWQAIARGGRVFRGID